MGSFMFVLYCTVAVLWIQHKLNTNYIPWRPNQVVHIERRGRQWKGNLPFDIYDDSCHFVTRDLYDDQNNGWWKFGGWIDLNRDHLIGKTPYAVLVEASVCDCKMIEDAPETLIKSLKAPAFHRPSSTTRYLIERYEKGDERVDVDFCNRWLSEYKKSKKSQRNDKSNDNCSTKTQRKRER